MARIRIDGDRCKGHGRCYALAPQLFDADDAGHGRVSNEEPEATLLEKARSAEANCPERAIQVEV